jgi:2-hydroxy-3-keto-5-methylthiopentenyl-1-phosphate phosphatase
MTPKNKRIALIMDWDDTLCPDSISALIQKMGLDPDAYWKPLDDRVKQGWDIVTAYMVGLAQLFKDDPKAEAELISMAQKHQSFPGTMDLVERCKGVVMDQFGPQVILETYILSSGLDTLIAHHPLSPNFDRHWSSSFHFEEGRIAFPKNVLNFSDKLRCLVQIHKGLSQQLPLDVTQKVDKKAVPYENMIYVGDGYTDIPCFSKITARGGKCMAVVPENRNPNAPLFQKLMDDGRVEKVCPADYRKGKAAWGWLEKALCSMEP